jgi:hypothetical protein
MCFSVVWEGYMYSRETTWVHRRKFRNTSGLGSRRIIRQCIANSRDGVLMQE